MLPELPSFLSGHIDPFTGIEDAGVQVPGAATIMTALGSAAAPVGVLEGAAEGSDPYAGMGLSRNAPCPCGSGNKYKHCHGAVG
jgi:preprotein translocase subunit SecA